MRKIYTLTFGLLLITSLLSSQELYWVGGSGSWNDQSHWSLESGGNGGYGIPSDINDVYIDENSLFDGDIISIAENVAINSILV